LVRLGAADDDSRSAKLQSLKVLSALLAKLEASPSTVDPDGYLAPLNQISIRAR
jgi:hypothetical protein